MRLPGFSRDQRPPADAEVVADTTAHPIPSAPNPQSPRFDLWRPFWLRKLFLFALIALFVAIGITLGVLFSQSNQHNGFSTASEGYYYLWTYGPTAVFTFIAALWAQVEYRSKQLMPWSALQRAPQRCENSLLLDYVEPMNVVSLFHSLRRSHLFAAVAIAGALLAQLMVVLSSGLFEAATVTVVYDNDAALEASEAFTGAYNNTITSRQANIVYGKMLYNLSYPLGTTQDYAYQLFNTSHSSVENTSAIVDIFSADLDCANATVTNVTAGFSSGLSDNPLFDGISFTVSTDGVANDVWLEAVGEPHCSGLVVKIKSAQDWNYNGSYCSGQPEGPDRNRLVLVSGTWDSEIVSTLTVDESTTTSTAGLIPASLLAGESSTATGKITLTPTHRISATSASTRSPSHGGSIQIKSSTATQASATASSSGYDIHLDDPPSDLTIGINAKRAELSTTTINSASEASSYFVLPTSGYAPSYAILCKPRYTIRKANVTLSKTASSADINTNAASSSNSFAFANMTLLEGDAAEERQLDDLAAWSIMGPVFSSIELSDSELQSGGLMSFINAMAPITKSDGLEQDHIVGGLRQAYRSVSAQVANAYLKQALTEQQQGADQNRTLTGSTTTQEARLTMQAPAFWITEMTLLVVIFGTSFLLLNSSDMRMSRDPGTVGGIATILARSEGTMQLLSGTGALPMGKIRDLIGHERQFAAGVVQASAGRSSWYEFLIETDDEAELRRQQPLEAFEESPKWYRPFAVSLFGRILIVSIPLALIVALEVLYQYSADHDGLADIDDSNRYVHYAWTFIPTLAMVAVSQLFGMLDFATKLFAPYSALSAVGGASAHASIMDNYLDKLGIHALFSALSRKQWAVAAVAVATVLSPLLTIVTSGLLTAAIAPANYTVAVTRLDSFANEGSSSAQRGNEGIVAANLVLANNLTYPQWTYDTLALPRFELASTQFSESTEAIAKNATSLRSTVPAIRGVANCTARPAYWFRNCNRIWQELSLAAVGDTFVPQVTVDFNGDGYFGRWEAPLSMYYENNTVSTTNYTSWTSDSPKCPPIISSYGRVENNTVVEATHLACHPYIEKIDTNITLSLPEYRVDVDVQPPEAPPIGADTSNNSVFSRNYWVFEASGDGWYKLTNPNPRNVSDEDLATLYGLAVWGSDGVPKEELMQDEKKLISRVERVYAQVTAQVLNKQRKWANRTSEAIKRDAADGDASSLTGSILYSGRTRLKQSFVSTRILEVLLAIMFICAALAAALLKTKWVLPKNPCSIAAMASLLVGSELLASITQGSEWMSDKQIKECGVFEGKVFSMGWWDTGVGSMDGSSSSTGRGRFGIDIGTAVSEKSRANDDRDSDSPKARWRPAWLRRGTS